jgi:hypothetical protein
MEFLKKLQSPVDYEAMFLKRRENVCFTCSKTLTLFGVGVHGLLQWNCLKEIMFLKRIENVCFPVSKTFTLLGVGAHCISQWNCFRKTAESCGLRGSVFGT